MKLKQVVVTALVLGLLVVCASAVRAIDYQGTFPMGTSPTEDKPQSKPWYTNDGPTWWGIFGDGTGSFFYKLVINGATSSFVKQTVTDALVDASPSARADVLWNGTHLFVLMYKGTTASFSKYTYNAGTQTYTRILHVPTITLSGGTSESATIDQDSTGRL
jgi:hypothetical protein